MCDFFLTAARFRCLGVLMRIKGCLPLFAQREDCPSRGNGRKCPGNSLPGGRFPFPQVPKGRPDSLSPAGHPSGTRTDGVSGKPGNRLPCYSHMFLRDSMCKRWNTPELRVKSEYVIQRFISSPPFARLGLANPSPPDLPIRLKQRGIRI
jgi:hypothetical protein